MGSDLFLNDKIERGKGMVRGDRLRSHSLEIKQNVNEDKENGNLNILNDKENNDEQQFNEASDLQYLRSFLLVVQCIRLKAKGKKWLQDLPNQCRHVVDEEDAFMWDQQKQITDESMTECDSILIQKHSLRRQSLGGLPKKQDKGNKCRRRSLLQKAVSKLPISNHPQTIIVEKESSFSNPMRMENVDQSRYSASAVSCCISLIY
uniref:Uncharacterized protein n=1 Tax=Wuchereria bancrofti TaxID=6293 RepID=A0A1I8ENN8_WUCBA